MTNRIMTCMSMPYHSRVLLELPDRLSLPKTEPALELLSQHEENLLAPDSKLDEHAQAQTINNAKA